MKINRLIITLALAAVTFTACDEVDEADRFKELEKIEMVRGLDGRYRMDHAVTATQKDILRAFHLDAAAVKKQADELSEMLNKYDRQTLEEQ